MLISLKYVEKYFLRLSRIQSVNLRSLWVVFIYY